MYIFLYDYAFAQQSNKSKTLKIQVGIGNHFSSSLLPTNKILTKSEFTQIFSPAKFTLNPELNVSIGKKLNQIIVGVDFAAILYQRILQLAVTTSAWMEYEISKQNTFYTSSTWIFYFRHQRIKILARSRL